MCGRILGLGRCFAPVFGVALVLSLSSVTFATGVTLPNTGVDLPGLVTAGLTAIGTALTVIIGAYFAYLAVRIVMKWARHMA